MEGTGGNSRGQDSGEGENMDPHDHWNALPSYPQHSCKILIRQREPTSLRRCHDNQNNLKFV